MRAIKKDPNSDKQGETVKIDIDKRSILKNYPSWAGKYASEKRKLIKNECDSAIGT